MPKLNDTQTILLSTASLRDDRSLYPLPDTITAGASLTKAINGLLRAGFAEKRDEGALFATSAGLAAIGVEENADTDTLPVARPTPEPRTTKSDAVIALMKREDGATLRELIAATGWLPHTTRAALTGLRKKGHSIERFKRDEATCYRIAA